MWEDIIIINNLIKTYQQVPFFHQLNKKEDCAMWSVNFLNLVVLPAWTFQKEHISGTGSDSGEQMGKRIFHLIC